MPSASTSVGQLRACRNFVNSTCPHWRDPIKHIVEIFWYCDFEFLNTVLRTHILDVVNIRRTATTLGRVAYRHLDHHDRPGDQRSAVPVRTKLTKAIERSIVHDTTTWTPISSFVVTEPERTETPIRHNLLSLLPDENSTDPGVLLFRTPIQRTVYYCCRLTIHVCQYGHHLGIVLVRRGQLRLHHSRWWYGRMCYCITTG